MICAITGASGYLGQHLVVALRKDGKIGAASLNKGFYYNVATLNSFKTVKVKGLLE